MVFQVSLSLFLLILSAKIGQNTPNSQPQECIQMQKSHSIPAKKNLLPTRNHPEDPANQHPNHVPREGTLKHDRVYLN